MSHTYPLIFPSISEFLSFYPTTEEGLKKYREFYSHSSYSRKFHQPRPDLLSVFLDSEFDLRDSTVSPFIYPGKIYGYREDYPYLEFIH